MLHKNCLIMFWVAGHSFTQVFYSTSEHGKYAEGWTTTAVSSSMCKESNKHKQVHDGMRARKAGKKIDRLDAILFGVQAAIKTNFLFCTISPVSLSFCIYWSNKWTVLRATLWDVSECNLEDFFFPLLDNDSFSRLSSKETCVFVHKFAKGNPYLSHSSFLCVGGWHRSRDKNANESIVRELKNLILIGFFKTNISNNVIMDHYGSSPRTIKGSETPKNHQSWKSCVIN